MLSKTLALAAGLYITRVHSSNECMVDLDADCVLCSEVEESQRDSYPCDPSYDKSSRHTAQITRSIICQNMVNGKDNPNCPGPWKTFHSLQNYGCNCFNQGGIRQGEITDGLPRSKKHGTALDRIDQACLNVINGFICKTADHDVIQDSPPSDPAYECKRTQPYRYYVDEHTNEFVCGNHGTPYADMRSQSPLRRCQNIVCQIELAFASTWYEEIQIMLDADIQAGHESADCYNDGHCLLDYFKSKKSTDVSEYPNSIYETNTDSAFCEKVGRVSGNGTPSSEEITCCGEYPTRYPFTGDHLFQVCCNDGSTADVGSC